MKMKNFLRNTLLFVLMVAASGLAVALRPTERMADRIGEIDFAQVVPQKFGDWHDEPVRTTQIVDPQQLETIDKIYAQTLTRTYVNGEGKRIMLSLAYGANQSDDVALHYPEVCYPAQGFTLLSEKKGVLQTEAGPIRVKRLMTQLGLRMEPVTYWTMLGDRVVQGGLETKIAQLGYSFKGLIPDGLLFRVSSVTGDAEAGYALQQEFVQSLIASLAEKDRLRLAGLSATRKNP